MRKGSVRVMDGKVDITDMVLAKAAPAPTEFYLEFLRDNLGMTDSALAEAFGDTTDKPE